MRIKILKNLKIYEKKLFYYYINRMVEPLWWEKYIFHARIRLFIFNYRIGTGGLPDYDTDDEESSESI